MSRFAAAFAIALLLPLAASAKPAYKQALAAHMGPYLPARLNDCRLCHVPGDTLADGTKPRNAFGERLEEVRSELKDAGKPTDIVTRFAAVANEDADGDGVANLIEVLTGHFPGDPKDKPTAEELRSAEKIVARYSRFI